MRRSKWKAFDINLVPNRSTIIVPEMIDKSFVVENGNSSRTIKITSDHVGHRLGEFYNSRISPVYKTKKKVRK